MEKVCEDLLGVGVALDLAIQIKANHVTGTECGGHFELFLKAFRLGSLHVLFCHVDLEMDRRVGVVLLVVLTSATDPRTQTYLDGRRRLVSTRGELLEHLLEVLGPSADRQFGDLHSVIANLVEDTTDFVLVLLDTLNRALASTRVQVEHSP